MSTLQQLIRDGAELNAEQKRSLWCLLADQLRAKKLAALRSKIHNVPLSCWTQKTCWVYDRIILEGDRFSHTPMQHGYYELKEARNAIMGWKR